MDPNPDQEYFLFTPKLDKSLKYNLVLKFKFSIRKRDFFYRFLFNILHFGSGSVDLQILAHSDPETQNVADPSDPNFSH